MGQRPSRGVSGGGSGGGSGSNGGSEEAEAAVRERRRERAAEESKGRRPPRPRHRLGAAPRRLPALPRLASRLKLQKLERISDWLALETETTKTEAGAETEAGRLATLVELLRGSPLAVGTLEDVVDEEHAIVSLGAHGEFCLRLHSILDRERLEPGCSLLVQTHPPSMSPGLFVVGVLNQETELAASFLRLDKAPPETFADVGGLEEAVEALRETVELPLLHPELLEEMGVEPPKGVILYGPPGTGKTLLAKAVANSTQATFIRVVGSELIKKHSGEGPKLVRELFKLAQASAPTILFIDEVDAIGTKRFETTSGGEREVQRTLLELLNQLDGFQARPDVKVIMATNRIQSLDPALIRPGRIDRKIHIPNPGPDHLPKVFAILSRRMNLAPEARTVKELGWERLELSGAELQAVCTEAGLFCLRERRCQVTREDMHRALQSVQVTKAQANLKQGLYL